MKLVSTGWLKQDMYNIFRGGKGHNFCTRQLAKVLGVSLKGEKRIKINVYDKPNEYTQKRLVKRASCLCCIPIFSSENPRAQCIARIPAPKSWHQHILKRDWPNGRVVYLETEVER